MKTNIYDLWLTDKAEMKIKEILTGLGFLERVGPCDPDGELPHLAEELGFSQRSHDVHGVSRFIYNSDLFPKWSRNLEKYEEILHRLDRNEIQTVSLLEPNYPPRLREIYDPPYLLFYKGILPQREARSAAIVGARKATEYGRWCAYSMSRCLAEHRVHVVSGMALGADTYAHKGAVDAGGRTTAVLGSGVDLFTPASNRRLAESILEKEGCILSEFLPGTPGAAHHYPRRNRIISGISECVIVVEAGVRSGTTITANMALEQGRDVYAVPGNITSVYSAGANRLIKEGAIPLISTEDILEEMNISPHQTAIRHETLGSTEQAVYNMIEKSGEITFENLCAGLDLQAPIAAGILTVLELKGMIFKIRNKIMIAK